ncbi:MAG TPA: hypothetical protein VK540_19035 [Polyangiaceae bacterium]|jgi:hypothetical protein|nr:hypothetical protein [Polyangiaceae bacterium]
MKGIVGAALVTAVAAVGYAAGTYRSAPAAVVREAQPARLAAEAPLTRVDIAAVVRAELAQMPLPAPAPIATASAAPPPAASEDRQEAPKQVSNPEARARAQAIVNDAIHFATWTDHDRELLREQYAQLGSDDWLEMTRALSVAINSGKLRVDTQGLPF